MPSLPMSEESVNSKMPSALKGQITIQPEQLHQLLTSTEFKWVEEQMLLQAHQLQETICQGALTPENLAAANYLIGKRKGLLEFQAHLYNCLKPFQEESSP